MKIQGQKMIGERDSWNKQRRHTNEKLPQKILICENIEPLASLIFFAPQLSSILNGNIFCPFSVRLDTKKFIIPLVLRIYLFYVSDKLILIDKNVGSTVQYVLKPNKRFFANQWLTLFTTDLQGKAYDGFKS